MRYLILVLSIMCSGSFWSQNQDSADIANQINTLFDGMRESDSAKVHSVFFDDVSLYSSITDREGKDHLHKGKLDEFLSAIGTPHDKPWDERIDNLVIQIDGSVAQAWMDYEFFHGTDRLHCGINALQLSKDNGVWKIIHLIDTRRKKGCE